MAGPEECYLKHDSVPNRMRYETRIDEPGKAPERIVCCRDCGMAIYQQKPERLPADADKDRARRVREAIQNPRVEIPKPVRLPDPPRVERSMGIEPPGYGRSL